MRVDFSFRLHDDIHDGHNIRRIYGIITIRIAAGSKCNDILESAPRLPPLIGIDRGSGYIQRCVFYIGAFESISFCPWNILSIAGDISQARASIECFKY
jgi:hypothetical protein